MKVLFICSGNNQNGISSIVRNQGESLSQVGIEVEYFAIAGKGILNYLRNVVILKKKIKKDSYCLYHAHYSFSGFAAALAGCKPLVVSLMGSDVHNNILFRSPTRFFSRHFWQATIVKSIQMQKCLNLRYANVIPNGVDLDLFKPIDREDALRKSGFKKGFNIIFVADPARPEKNYKLAKGAVEKMGDPRVHLHAIFGKSQQELFWYYNAADMLLMTSLWEGSPNVVKEAMSCNLPIVTTDVGDVKEIIRQTEGCFVCSYSENDVMAGIQKIMSRGKRTNGRERIFELQLDSKAIAQKITSVYNNVLKMTDDHVC